MPQLNPAPWFLVFLLVWLTIIMMLSKVLKYKPSFLPPQQETPHHTSYWTWPWP